MKKPSERAKPPKLTPITREELEARLRELVADFDAKLEALRKGERVYKQAQPVEPPGPHLIDLTR